METLILYTHIITMSLFTLLITVKTIQLAMGKIDQLERLKKATQVPEVFDILLGICSGLYLMINTPVIPMWMWLNVAALCLAIPLGVNAFRYHKQAFGPVTLALLFYVLTQDFLLW